jgi:triosephosphate isomerase
LRTPLIAGNWKMNKSAKEAVELVRGIKAGVASAKDTEVLICPTYTSLAAVKDEINGTNIKLGAQNMHWEAKGAYTGEISGPMLAELGVSYVIIGHSERRQYFAETDENVNKKTRSAFKYKLTPIACIGETLEERENNTTFKVIERQIRSGLASLSEDESKKLVIAYEPVWAIGTGKTATPDQAQEVHAFIRKIYSQMYGADASQCVRILYGGSMKPDNVSELMKKPDIDGGLIGGAALEADSFNKLLSYN